MPVADHNSERSNLHGPAEARKMKQCFLRKFEGYRRMRAYLLIPGHEFSSYVLRGAICDFALKPTLKVFGKCGLWVCCSMPRRLLPSDPIIHARQGFLIPQISDSIVLRRLDICTGQDFVLITVESRLHWCWRALSGFRSVISSILIFFTGR
jgi:hypothetical protein